MNKTQSSRRPKLIRLRVIAGFLIIGLGAWVLIQRYYNNLDYLVVTSESMEPTLRIGDRVLMERAAQYRVGEIVVFEEPDKPDMLVVKRIMAMPGDVVEVRGDDIKVTHPIPTVAPNSGRAWLINPWEVFVAGDNRPVSHDSRDYGPIPLESIRGTVRYKLISRFRWAPVY